MPRYEVTIDEHTITTYEIEAEDEEEVVTEWTFDDETPTNTNVLNWSITSVREIGSD